MPPRKQDFQAGQKITILDVRVTPRAAKNEVTTILEDGTIKIRLTAPPVAGKANEALIGFLANTLGVSKRQIEIVTGHTGRKKRVSVMDMDRETIQYLLAAIMKDRD